MFPRWLSWLFVLLMGYLIYTGNRAAHQQAVSADTKAEAVVTNAVSIKNYPSLQQFTNTDRWKRAVDPGYVGTAKIIDATVGTGAVAQCGSLLTIHLRGTLADGDNFDAAHDESKPLQFALGNAPYAVLNQALVGMREGGVRQISAPPQEVYAQGSRKTRDDVLLRITLDHVAASATDKNALGLKVIQEREGDGAAALCGEAMSVTMTVWGADGVAEYHTPQPIRLTLGKDALPSAFAEGLNGLRVGESRTLILPPEPVKGESKLPGEIRKALGGGKLVILSVTRSV